MTDILMSIRPEWVEKICEKIAEEDGKPVYKKRIEVRKTKPSKELPVRVFIYCTKHKERLIEVVKKGDDIGWGCTYKEDKPLFIKAFADSAMLGSSGIGKVIGEFICDKVLEWNYLPDHIEENGYEYYIECKDGHATCLTYDEIENYGKGKTLYGWHITDLKIYDKPKELSEFYPPTLCSIYDKIPTKQQLDIDLMIELPSPQYHKSFFCKKCKHYNGDFETCVRGYSIKPIARPPQSWCYVEVRE